MHLADTEGLETLAELWSGAPADSLAGALWRLYLLRSWVYADPRTAAAEFDRGRVHVPVAEVVSGVVDPPGPDEVRALVDEVLGGVVVGDFADTLLRAAAFARVAAAGRVHGSRAEAPTARRTPPTCRPRGCSPSPTSSTGPLASRSTARWPDEPDRPGVSRYSGRRVGPWQPRVPISAATSGHAP